MTKQATTDKGIFIFGTSGREYTVTATRQGWQFTEIKKINDELYRVFIERDSYDIQCHAQVEMWTSVGWKILHSEPLTSLPAISVFAYAKFEDLDTDLFLSTADILWERAGGWI